MFINWCLIIFATMLYPLLEVWVNYAFYIILNVGTTLVLLKIMPETSGRRFSGIEREMVNQPKKEIHLDVLEWLYTILFIIPSHANYEFR